MKKAFFSSESNFKYLSSCKKIKNGNGSCSFFSQTMYHARFKFKNKECGSTSRRKPFKIKCSFLGGFGKWRYSVKYASNQGGVNDFVINGLSPVVYGHMTSETIS